MIKAFYSIVLLAIAILLSGNYCVAMNDKGENNIVIAKTYYTAMAEKNIAGVAQYLDENVIFIAPLTTVVGKQEFLERVKEFFAYSANLTIRVVFGSHDQGMVVFTLDYPMPIGIVEAAALLTMQDGLISKIELFYDARLFEKRIE